MGRAGGARRGARGAGARGGGAEPPAGAAPLPDLTPEAQLELQRSFSLGLAKAAGGSLGGLPALPSLPGGLTIVRAASPAAPPLPRFSPPHPTPPPLRPPHAIAVTLTPATPTPCHARRPGARTTFF